MKRCLRFLGSLSMAVGLLIAIAAVLAWGTIYETQFGTAAVQRFMYQSWWFQALLGFLALNLAVAAFERWPWKRKHVPFLLAHLGIICILIGGIIGGRFGIDGQLIIPEGQANRLLQLPQNVLVVAQSNPGIPHVIPTRFETTAWKHEPHAMFQVPLEDRPITLVVDRYYPNAEMTEQITNDGQTDNPAVQVTMRHQEQEASAWLLARDPERFGMRWGEAHLLLLQPETEEQLAQLIGKSSDAEQSRGMLMIELADQPIYRQLVVPEDFSQPVPIEGTPYVITFKQYFPDFTLTEQGPANRSEMPNNPAIALTLSGPEGTDAHLLFALHPDFPALHGRTHQIHAHLTYTHPAGASLPPQTIAILRQPSGALSAVLTGGAGERQYLKTLELGASYTHPWLGYEFAVTSYYVKARLIQEFRNRNNDVRVEVLHLMAQDGEQTAEAWLGLRGAVELPLGEHPVRVEYKPAEQELPFTVKLIDFRKIDYPGTTMAAGFESDVQLTDPQRGTILIRKISMNNPLKYRGFSLFQSSFIDGEPQMTVLSVRNDPGTPFVYTGFLIVIAGVVWMFITRSKHSNAAR